jgi:hypothetical protein
VRSEPTESRLGEERLEVAEAQIGAGHYQLAVVISQVAVETVAEVGFTVLFGVNVPRSRETLVKVLPDRSFLVMAENDARDIQRHHLAYAHGLQETPFRFTSAAQLTDTTKLGASGRPHRGPSSAPVFVLNHWVDTNTHAASVSGDPQGSSSAARASADVSAYPQPLRQPDRRRLLSPSGRVRRRRRAERRVPMSGRMR